MARADRTVRRTATSGRVRVVGSRSARTGETGPLTTSGPAGGRYLIDTSVWGRVSEHAAVRLALRALIEATRPATVLVCPPVAVEYGFSVRSGPDHTNLMQRLSAFPDCPITPSTADVLRIQNALWNGGLLRAVGSMDTLIAAYGIANTATIVHYDSDFEHVAAAVDGFTHQWIVPRGSI